MQRTGLKFVMAILLAGHFSYALAAEPLPLRGSSKSQINSDYGDPISVQGPVGDPPITRWLYDNFTVVFEYDHVIHSFPRQYELENRPASDISARPSTSGDTLDLSN